MPRPRKYPEELMERGARLVFESGRPIAQVAADLGVRREALRKPVRQAGAAARARRERAASRERDSEGGERVFRQGARPDPIEVSAFIDEHRERFGVEPICRTLGVSASAYYHRASGERSARRVEDERLLEEIRRVHKANYECYGYRRTWKQLLREGERVPRCRVQRLMRDHGIQGAKRRGKPWRTTNSDPRAERRPDLVCRDFTAGAPNRLW